MSVAAQRRSPLVLALSASLLLHGLAVALAPLAKAVAASTESPLSVAIIETIKPAPPPPAQVPPPVRLPRAARTLKSSAPPTSAAVVDQQGELEAPATEQPLVFTLPLQPFTSTTPHDEPAPRGPPVETSAALQSEVQPAYPEAARLDGVDGVVELRVTIGEDGRVLDAKIVTDPGYGLGEAARAAVLKARFAPATRDGARIPSTILWRYRFELR